MKIFSSSRRWDVLLICASAVSPFFALRKLLWVVPTTAPQPIDAGQGELAAQKLYRSKSVPHDIAAASSNQSQWLQSYIDMNDYRRNESAYNEHYHIRWFCDGFCGGVGDRFNGIVQAFYMAMSTNRTFSIAWANPHPLSKYLKPRLIDWHRPAPRAEGAMRLSAVAKPLNGYLNNPMSLPNDTDVRVSTNIWRVNAGTFGCLDDYFSRFEDGHSAKQARFLRGQGTNHDPTLFRLGFWTLFQWSPLVLRSTAAIRKKFDLGLPYVAVHVRTGRGLEFTKRVGNNETTWPRYYKCARKLQEGLQRLCATDGKVPIYVASDNANAKQAFADWDFDKSVRTVLDMEAMHTDLTPLTALSNASAAELGVWNDLKLLTDATCLVMSSRSRFSHLAKRLAPQPRCAVGFDDCGSEQVERALATLSANGGVSCGAEKSVPVSKASNFASLLRI